MNDLQDNPYASPQEVGSRWPSERSMIWQTDVAHALKLVPLAIAYHLSLPILNFFANPARSLPMEWLVVSFSLFAWVVFLIYSCWFAGLLYGRIWGILLAPLASFPLVGLPALWMFYVRARLELTNCGWQVRGFTTSSPDENA